MIVATAGHVDHGKTLLVKALTGMDTDRLEEEKRRGLSINLGFAYRKLSNNRTTSFVDVPGHNRFINNMIAGVNGIDLALLVVAADDGPMPQTLEHVDVLKLLGVSRFAVVITKIDRADKARVALVRAAALALFPQAKDLPVFEVNTPAGNGVSELKAFLDDEENRSHAKACSGYFRMSIDRAFNMKGSGLVVTGTIASGSIRSGESLQLLPQNISLRVRSLQVQEQQVEQAGKGQRCAFNIVGNIEKSGIERGDWLVDPHLNQTSSRFDARVRLTGQSPITLKHMSPVKLYIGAKRTSARLALLNEKNLSAGQDCLAQIICKTELQCCHGDRFLLRDDSENITLGGGVILDPYASSRRRSTQSRLQILEVLEQGSSADVLSALLFEQKQLVNKKQFCQSWNIREDEQAESLGLTQFANKITIIEHQGKEYIIATDNLQSIVKWTHSEIKSDASTGTTPEKFKANFVRHYPQVDAEIILMYLHNAGSIIVAKDKLQLNREEGLSDEQAALWSVIQNYLRANGPNIPVIGELSQAVKGSPAEVKEALKLAIKRKWMVMLVQNRFVLAEHMQQFADAIEHILAEQSAFSVAEFKNKCGIGRNLAVEVLEYFDKIGFTLRKDAGRVILHRDRVKTHLQQHNK